MMRSARRNVFNCSSVRGVVLFPNGTILLTKREAELLTIVSARPGIVISKDMLMERMYGGLDEPEMKVIDVYVCKVRRKLEAALGSLDVIETVWGRGYRFVPEGFRPSMSDARVRLAG